MVQSGRVNLSSASLVAALIIFSFSFSPLVLAAEGQSGGDSVITLKVDGIRQKVTAASDELIIKYKDDVNLKEKNDFKTENGIEAEALNRDPLKKVDLEGIDFGDGVTAEGLKEIEAKLEQDPAVEYAEPNYTVSLLSEPSDSHYSKQWALPKMQVADSWMKGRGSPSVIIAVLDTGFDYTHPDKPTNLVSGYDFVNDDADPRDDHGHGTFIAGVISANTDNGLGISGICSGCSIMPVKVMDSKGVGTYANVARGIMWAADNRAKIINLSLGGYAPSQALQEAVTYAQQKGVLIIAAGGNQGTSALLYPAAYSSVLGVSATDQNDQHWSKSNTGSYIDLSAPGVDVYGLSLGGGYQSQTGSSVAAANASGVAALLWSQSPGGANSITQTLHNYAIDLGPEGRDTVFGYGRVKAAEAKEENIDLPNKNTHVEIPKNSQCDIDQNKNGEDGEHYDVSSLHDLAVKYVGSEPSTFNQDDGAKIIVLVYNRGTSEEKEVVVSLFVDGVQLESKTIDVLKPDSTQSLFFSWKPEVKLNEKAKFKLEAKINTISCETKIDDNIGIKDFTVENKEGQITEESEVVSVPSADTPKKEGIEGNDKDKSKENGANKSDPSSRVKQLSNVFNITEIKIQSFTGGKINKNYDSENNENDKGNKVPFESSNKISKNINRDENGNNGNDSNEDVKQDTSSLHNSDGPLNFDAEDTIGIVVDVLNQGQAKEENVLVRAYMNFHQFGEDQIIPVLDAGEVKSVVFPWHPQMEKNKNQKNIFRVEVKPAQDEIKIDDNILTNFFSVTDKDGTIEIQYDVNPPVHQYLTEQGAFFLHDVNLGAYEEIKNYLAQLKLGARNEDEINLKQYDPNNKVEWRPLRHFYRPTDKKGYFDGGSFNVSTFWAVGTPHAPADTRYQNSYQWATNKKADSSGAENIYSFQNAVDEYKKGNHDKAYETLGHVLHLIEDASVPEHTQIESHSDVAGGLDVGSGYEQYVTNQYDSEKLNKLLHNFCFDVPGSEDPCFIKPEKKAVFSYYNQVISKFSTLDQYFDSIANLSYNRNRFQADLNNQKGEASGELKKMFPSLSQKPHVINKYWDIDSVGDYGFSGDNEAVVRDEWWETAKFDNNPDIAGRYYIENSYKALLSPYVRPAEVQADWYSYALAEMKKPQDQRFKTPYSGAWVKNDPDNGKILAETFAEDLIPLAVQHVAGVMDLFWKETHKNVPPPQNLPPKPLPPSAFPDLRPVINDTFSFVQTNEDTEKDGYRYEVKVKVENLNDTPSKGGSVCLLVGPTKQCRGITTLLTVTKGKDYFANLSLASKEPLAGDPIAWIRIINVPSETKLDNNEVAVSAARLQDLGGVDLTSAELAGIRIDPTTDQIKFIIKGTEAKDGDTVIDLKDARSEQGKMFLQALAIPNFKQYISLDIVPDGNQMKGSARVPEPFENTDLADSFLKADVAMKFDLFGARRFDSTTDWTNLVQASPYWNELKNMGFNRYPTWVLAATIVPGNIDATQTGNQFFMENIKLDLNAGWWMREPKLNFDGLTLRPVVKQDLLDRLATHKADIENAVKTRALTFTLPSLNDLGPDADPRFKKLRMIYAAISAAQWYKEQVKLNPDLPYASIVDSEKLDGISIDHPFDWDYWNGQALQDLGTLPCTSFAGAADCGARGGASLQNSEPKITGELSEAQDNILSSTLDNFETVKTDEADYLYGGTVSASRPDLEMGQVSVDADKYLKGVPLKINVQWMNAGTQPADKVLIRLYDEFTSPSGQKTLYPVGEKMTDAVAAWEEKSEAFDWTLPGVVGTHQIHVQADPLNTIKEGSETNNESIVNFETVDLAPQLFILAPLAGSVVNPKDIVFTAQALDALTGPIVDPVAYNWSSSLSGNLGSGSEIKVGALAIGDHVITLTVMGPQGVSASKTFTLFVRAVGVPLPKIQTPFEGAHLSQELPVRLLGEAVDNEDGLLNPENLQWSSDLDGDLGGGNDLEKLLSPGLHTLSLTATDSSGQSAFAQIHVTVEKGLPSLNFISPLDQAIITEGDAVNFKALATDPQEGDISSRILWSSDLEGLLDQQAEFSKILKVGTHRITATVVDSDGLSDSVQRTITIKNSAPVPVITSPADGFKVNLGLPVTFEGSAADHQDGAIGSEKLVWSSDRDGYLGQGEKITLNSLSAGWHLITLAATDSENEKGMVTVHLNVYAGIPTAHILQPALGQIFKFGSNVTLEGNAHDDQDGDLSVNHLTWTSSLDGNVGSGNLLNLNSLSIGTHTLRFTAVDNDGWKATDETSITISPLQAPQVSILFPKKDGVFEEGKWMHFFGMASDPEDGNILSEHIKWTSSMDGELGTGFFLSSNHLSVGHHTLTLTATDQDGLTAAAQVLINIIPAPPTVTISQPLDGTVVPVGQPVTLEGSGAVTLSWSSSLDGALGIGSSLIAPNLSVGSHLITLSGTDEYGHTVNATVTVVMADESQMLLKTFSDDQETAILNFSIAHDQTVTLDLPKEAIVTTAQVKVQPDRALLSGVQKLFIKNPADKLFAAFDSRESLIPSTPLSTKNPEKDGGGAGEPVDLEEDLGVMSTNYTVVDHHNTGTADWVNPPFKSSFAVGSPFYSWLKIGNLTQAGQIKWVWHGPAYASDWVDCTTNIDVGFEWWGAYCGWDSTIGFPAGQWTVDVYLKSNSDADWKYYFTDLFQMHESPSLPPVLTISKNPANGAILENQNVSLALSCDDNSQSVVSREFYWNDGTGWQNNSDNGYYLCAGGSLLKWLGNSWINATNLSIGSFPEGKVVQYYGKVTDFEGNVTQTPTQSFSVSDNDTTGPTITSISVTEGDTANGDGVMDETEPVKITWQAADVSGVQSSNIVIDGVIHPALLEGAVWKVQVDPLSEGVHSYVINATDADNSPASSNVNGTFTVLRRAILINPSMDAGNDGSLEWSFEGEMTDPQITPNFADALNFYLQGHLPGNDGRVEVPLHFHADGGDGLKLSQLNVSYHILDITPPVIALVTVNPVTPQVGENVTVTAEVSDNLGVAQVTASFRGTPVELVDGGGDLYTGSLVAPAAGMQTVTVMATDITGLKTSKTVPVTVVFNGSELRVEKVVFDPDAPLLSGDTVMATVTVKNSGKTIANTTLKITDVTEKNLPVNVPAEGTVDVQTSFVLPEPGDHSFTAEIDPGHQIAESDEGNNTFIQAYQTTDSLPPVFGVIEVPDKAGTNQGFNVTGSVTDNVGIKKVWATWLGQEIGINVDENGHFVLPLIAPGQTGEPVLQLKAEDESGLFSVFQKTVSVIDARPNFFLRNTDLVSEPANILPLDELTFTFHVHNDGGSAADVPVKIDLDGNEVTRTSAQVSASGVADVLWKGWKATGGSHQLTVTLDPEGQVDETDENDNTLVFDFIVPYTLPPQLSNLTIPEKPIAGQNFQISVDVLGDQELQSVLMELNGTTLPMIHLGQTDTYQFTTALEAGMYPFTITATNVSGLFAKLPGSVQVYSDLPDFSVKDFGFSPLQLTNRDIAIINATLKNNGVKEAEAKVVLYLDNDEIYSGTIDLLPGSETPLDPFTWSPTPGMHTLQIVTDPDSDVTEIDETNNTQSLSFRVGNVVAPKIKAVTSKDMVYMGELFPVTATVTDDTLLTVSALWDGSEVVMNEDSATIFSISLIAPATLGDHLLQIKAVNADGLTSTWTKVITVLDSKPDLSLTAENVTLVPKALIEGQKETFSTIFHNFGGSDVTDIPATLHVNGLLIATKPVSIVKGGEANVDWEWLPSYGLQNIEIIIDSDNLVLESDEANNQYQVSLLVRDVTPPSTPLLKATTEVQSESWSEVKHWEITWPDVIENNLKSYQTQVDGGLWIDVGIAKQTSVDFDTAGEHQFCVRAEDLAGNLSEPGCTQILLDFEAPHAPVLSGGTGEHWSSDTNQAIQWNVPLDDGSGPKTYKVRINGVEGIITAENAVKKRWDDGEYKIEVAAVDAVNHVSSWSNTIRLAVDSTAPETINPITSATHPDQKVLYRNGNPTFDWKTPADLSGVEGYYYYIDEKPDTVPDSRYAWTTISHLDTPEDRTLESGKYFLHVTSVDKAGNVSKAAHYAFGVDFEAPVTFLTEAGDNRYAFDVYDDYSGVAKTFYALKPASEEDERVIQEEDLRYEDFEWQPVDSFKLPKKGKFNVFFYSEDLAGNREAIGTDQVEFKERPIASPGTSITRIGSILSTLTSGETDLLPPILLNRTIKGKTVFSRPVRLGKNILKKAADGIRLALLTGIKGFLTLAPESKSLLRLIMPPNTKVMGTKEWNGVISPPVFVHSYSFDPHGEVVLGTEEKLIAKNVLKLVRLGLIHAPFSFLTPATLEVPIDLPDGTTVHVFSSMGSGKWESVQEVVVKDGKITVKISKSGYYAVRMQ